MMQRITRITLLGLLVLISAGCAGVMSKGHMGGMDHMDHRDMATPIAGMNQRGMMSGTQTLTDTTMMSGTAMGGMAHSMMQVDPTKPFDAQFIDSMIEHHQGAVAMAKQALESTEHEEVRTLAQAIIAAQTKEIEQMTAWRTRWYPDLAPTGGMGMSMGQMTISADESKPFDQRFIEAMIPHHQGAIEMAKMAQHMAEHQEIKSLADAIIQAQQTEITQMQSWLKAWFK